MVTVLSSCPQSAPHQHTSKSSNTPNKIRKITLLEEESYYYCYVMYMSKYTGTVVGFRIVVEWLCIKVIAGRAAAWRQIWSDSTGTIAWPLSSGRRLQRWVRSCVWCAFWGIGMFHHISRSPKGGDGSGLRSWWDEARVGITGESVCVCMSVCVLVLVFSYLCQWVWNKIFFL